MQTKETQGRLWSTAPAHWVTYFEPVFVPLYRAILSNVALDEEKMLLDAGCGAGLFLSMAEPTGAYLQGVDAAPGMLAVARQRLPGVPLLAEDLEDLPFIDGTFDVVTGLNSFQYAGSFATALAEARRVVKRHGRVVVALWGREEDCEAAAVFNAVAALLPPSPGTLEPFAWSEDGKVESVCRDVGLKVLGRHTVFCPLQVVGDEALQDAFRCTAPVAGTVLAAGEKAVREAIVESAQPFSLARGVYSFRNAFTFFITEKI